ncbi:MAG: hypothetical protein ACYCSJ_00395 [Acidimicrobiales bacterium]
MIEALAIVGTLVVLSVLLGVTELAEQRIINEPLLLVKVASSDTLSPEYVEAYVSRRAAKLLT